MTTETTHTHTQGPWRAHVAHANLVTHSDFVCTESGLHVCDVASYGESPDKRNANARLIASAPELFEALREIESALTALLCERVLDSTLPEFFQVRNARNSARAAIAKAEGNA